MTQTHTAPVLVIGATGNIGSLVVDELIRSNVPVQALSRSPASARVQDGVEVMSGDLQPCRSTRVDCVEHQIV